MAKETDKPQETEFEKRVRETAEANAKLEGESNAHLKQHAENQEKAKKEKEAREAKENV